MTRFTFIHVSVALFCFFECIFYVVFCRLIFFLVWLKYLFFVFNLWSVWINLYIIYKLSNYLPFTQHTAVRWCVNVLTGIRCVYDSVKSVCAWWCPPLSCHTAVHAVTHSNASTLRQIQNQFLSAEKQQIFIFCSLLKMEKEQTDIMTNRNKPHFLRSSNQRHFCTLLMIQYLSVNAVSFMLGKM